MITRTAMVDDDGSGTTGTIFNNAWKTALYDQIDAALVAGGTLTGDLLFTDALYDIGKSGVTRPRDGFFSRHVTVGGLLTVNGFGAHAFTTGAAGFNQIRIRNTASGTGDGAGFDVGNDASAQAGQLLTLSSTYPTSGDLQAWATALRANQSGGLSIAATHASGVIRFYSGGTTERVRLHASGGVSIGDTTDPGATNLRAAGTINAVATGVSTGVLVGAASGNYGARFARTAGGTVLLGVAGTTSAEHLAIVNNAGSDLLDVSGVGNISIGPYAARATTVGTRALQIFDGTPPVGALVNGVSLYSSGGKLFAMSAAGVATQLTP